MWPSAGLPGPALGPWSRCCADRRIGDLLSRRAQHRSGWLCAARIQRVELLPPDIGLRSVEHLFGIFELSKAQHRPPVMVPDAAKHYFLALGVRFSDLANARSKVAASSGAPRSRRIWLRRSTVANVVA